MLHPYNRAVPERGGKYEVLSTEAREGFLETLRVRGPNGEGRLYWFEVHDPEARAAFFRYRNALKRLERLDALPPGVDISTKPGRYYVFWPALGEPTPIKGRKARRKIAEIEAAIRPLGYRLSEAVLGNEGGRPVVLELHPFPSAPAEPEPAAPPRRSRALTGWLPGLALAILGMLLLLAGAQRYFNPPSVVLPNLVGKTAKEAQQALQNAGLVLQFVPESRPDAPTGVILEQDPPPGTRLKPGRRVQLVYNRPELRQVPVLVGKSRAEAEARLSELGYRVVPPAETYDDAPADQVIASDPPAGTPLAAGEPVRLLVSLGPLPSRTMVPDLEGTDPDEAKALLDLAGLQLGQEETLPSPLPRGTLLAQSPKPGTVIETGAPVVTARATPPEVLVPEAPAAPTPSEARAPESSTEQAPPSEPTPSLAEGEHRVPLKVRLPATLEGRNVRLVVTDEEGTRVLYEGPTQKGWRLEGEVVVKGKADFKLYVGDYLYQEWTVGP